MEAHAYSALREQVFRERITLACEVTRAQECNNARDIRPQSQNREVPMQLDVIIERLRNARRLFNRRNLARRFGCELNAPLDLPNFVCVLPDRSLIRSTEGLPQALQF